jgi:hypothetical protein
MSQRKPPMTRTDVNTLQAALEQTIPHTQWLVILKLLCHTGLADTAQMRTAAGLSYHQLEAFIARCAELAGDALLARVSLDVPRPKGRGRRSTIYALGEAGAALLRYNGHRAARACGLTDATAIAHALATLDVRLAARQARLDVQTERELPYGDGHVLRPDNQIAFLDGTRALFEIEQAADVTLLRRIIESVRRKAAFFRTDIGRRFSPAVRILINLPRGKQWDATLATWERATAVVTKEHGGRLPFRLLALPMIEFLAHPDWEEPPDAGRWELLCDPTQLPSAGPIPADKSLVKTRGHAPQACPTSLPEPLRRCSAHDDQLILLAFWQVFREQSSAFDGNLARPDPAFFGLMRLIYAVSHDPAADSYTRASIPHASLYLLKQYLAMHASLREKLSKTITRGASSIKWSVPTILHKMEVVIAEFLRYHGWQMDGPLSVRPDLGHNGRAFDVTVVIRAPELLMTTEDGIVPGRDAVQQTEKALSWVLWALFAHSEDVGLKRAAFW